jgi:hypothetical protein
MRLSDSPDRPTHTAPAVTATHASLALHREKGLRPPVWTIGGWSRVEHCPAVRDAMVVPLTMALGRVRSVRVVRDGGTDRLHAEATQATAERRTVTAEAATAARVQVELMRVQAMQRRVCHSSPSSINSCHMCGSLGAAGGGGRCR